MPNPPLNPDSNKDLTALQACRDEGHVWVSILPLVANIFKNTRQLVGCDRCGVVRWKMK